MRQSSLAILVVGACLASCAQENAGSPPPSPGQPDAGFYYPTGIAFVPDANGGPGFLYVVSSDFDLRYNRGTLAAVDLSTVPIPDTAGINPVNIDDPHITSQVKIDVFGGPLVAYHRSGTGPNERRLFVAGRQQNTIDAVDVVGGLTACAPNPFIDAGSADADDCASASVPLTDAISDTYRLLVVDDKVFASSLTPKDDPTGSDMLLVNSVARIDAETLGGLVEFPLGPQDTDLGAEAVAAMESLDGLLVLGGRPVTGATSTFNQAPLRVVPLDAFDGPADGGSEGLLIAPQLDVRDIRAMALSSDGTRLYMTTRAPDALEIIDVTPGQGGFPSFQVVAVVEMPAGAAELVVLPRGPGRSDVVAVTCETAGVIALYDDEIGRVVSEVRGGGAAPFGIAASPRPGSDGGARLYTTAFSRGNIAITDVPDLDNLSSAAVLVTMGPNENCLNDTVSARPPECQ